MSITAVSISRCSRRLLELKLHPRFSPCRSHCCALRRKPAWLPVSCRSEPLFPARGCGPLGPHLLCFAPSAEESGPEGTTQAPGLRQGMSLSVAGPLIPSVLQPTWRPQQSSGAPHEKPSRVPTLRFTREGRARPGPAGTGPSEAPSPDSGGAAAWGTLLQPRGRDQALSFPVWV